MVIDDIAALGSGTAFQEEPWGTAELETLILSLADEQIRAGDTRAAIALERVARVIAEKWPRLETIEDELKAEREEGHDAGYNAAAECYSETLDDGAALLQRWIDADEHRRKNLDDPARTGDLVRDSRTWINKRHNV